ncbi:hypothetical protein H5399_09030 [Tessaracoccus sp. MC1627]|uniref:hypothetical protein n=1 Tax=Tessaracoccus sp. MC1627 TaxID=2760312 RepID=UPI0016013A09|nr:hypothetical protein [Tessaracoccus sp. MC1627]MBB1512745.1 hypothetical protein [Tessaracoccus sp. MC1627]
MSDLDLTRTWSHRLAPLFGDLWFEARREILMASRMEMDDTVWMTSPPDHMGDPAKKVDQAVHQLADSGLRRLVKGIQVLGEEATLTNLLLRTKDYRYLAYLDAVDGSAQAWSLPGAWGHVTVIQEFTGSSGQEPQCAARFVGVMDAEGGTTMAEEGLDYVAVDMVDRMEQDTYDDDWISYSGEIFEVTHRPVVLVGGYKPQWWERFAALRLRIRERWPATPEMPGPAVFNTAGAPVTRKVIQNADNVVVQLTPSSLWDGAGAALISRAGGHVVRVGETAPQDKEAVWAWWSQFGYQRDPKREGHWVPAMHVPPFVAGMDYDRVVAVAELCLDLPV